MVFGILAKQELQYLFFCITALWLENPGFGRGDSDEKSQRSAWHGYALHRLSKAESATWTKLDVKRLLAQQQIDCLMEPRSGKHGGSFRVVGGIASWNLGRIHRRAPLLTIFIYSACWNVPPLWYFLKLTVCGFLDATDSSLTNIVDQASRMHLDASAEFSIQPKIFLGISDSLVFSPF